MSKLWKRTSHIEGKDLTKLMASHQPCDHYVTIDAKLPIIKTMTKSGSEVATEIICHEV